MMIQKASHHAGPTCVSWGGGVKNARFRPILGNNPDLFDKIDTHSVERHDLAYAVTTSSTLSPLFPHPRSRGKKLRNDLPHFVCVKIASSDSLSNFNTTKRNSTYQDLVGGLTNSGGLGHADHVLPTLLGRCLR